MSIHWEMFSWEAFATLTAVIAAGWVGWNQVKIQRRQMVLNENDLKIQLLDKRSACVKSMREIHYAWYRERHLSDDDWKLFHALSQDAILLYPKKVTQKLDKVVDGIFWAKQHYKRSQIYDDREEHGLASKQLEESRAEEDKVMRIMPKLLDEIIDYTRVDAWK